MQVTWSRVGDAPLDDVRHRQAREGSSHSLTIDQVRPSDLGRYFCRGYNDLGTAAAVIELAGQQTGVIVRSSRANSGHQRSNSQISRLGSLEVKRHEL